MGKSFFDKYPMTQSFDNLNDELYKYNPQAKIDFDETLKTQTNLLNVFFEKRKDLCSNSKHNNLTICSDMFEQFYAQKNTITNKIR